LDLGWRALLEMLETHYNVGHLHSRVVDVILHFDAMPRRTQHSDEGVTQDRVAQMADVSGLVGIDIGMLDDDLAGFRVVGGRDSVKCVVGVCAAIEPHVDVAVSGYFEACDAFDGA